MKILHTSDWHLGRTLYGKRRTPEFEAFLDWLLTTLQERKIDVLIVAGDIFDTTAPSNRMQQLYYRFLCRTAESGCRHVVVVGGNHDSASFLDAPKELLSFLDVHIVGAVSSKLEDELLVLRDSHGEPELLVCAVPYLRDRDIRFFEPGESFEDKNRKLVLGIEAHYRKLGRLAEERRAEAGKHVPIVATGHLFAAGGKTAEGDGVRDLYVGSLIHVGADSFPACIDYLALGHLHAAQKVNGSETMRYSGSPLPMNPSEAGQDKSVVLVEFEGTRPVIEILSVPEFQKMERVAGDLEALEVRLRELTLHGDNIWIEVVYRGEEIVPDLRERVFAWAAGSKLEILRIKNERALKNVLDGWGNSVPAESLDDLDESDVFLRCLEARSIPESERPGLLNTYREALSSLRSDER